MGFIMPGAKKERYFAVTTPLRINGKKYTPSVCYALTEDIELAVVSAVKEGKTIIYNERVRFISGRPVFQAKEEPVIEVVAEEKTKAIDEEKPIEGGQKKSTKKTTRNF